MHLLTQPPLGADSAAVDDQEHADHQLGVNRWAPDRAMEGLELPADVAQPDELVDGTQQVIARHMLLEAEAVEQRLLPNLPLLPPL